MRPDLPSLTFLPVQSLVPHEHFDERRTPPLMGRIRAEGVIRHPPVVTPLPDGSDRYLILDGANRKVAIERLGFPHILVQVVQPEEGGLELRSWNHVICGLPPRSFLQDLRAISGAELAPVHALPKGQTILAEILNPQGEQYVLYTGDCDLPKRAAMLHSIVGSYKQAPFMDRTQLQNVQTIGSLYRDLSGLVMFPAFTVADLTRLARSKHLLPSGVTCTVVSPRALGINFPLEKMAPEISLEEKNLSLNALILQKLQAKHVRFYNEATFLFDE